MGLKHIPVRVENFPFPLGTKFIEHGYTVLVETGTYMGGTALEAGKYFKRVHTIEASESLFRQAGENCKENKSIFLYHGDTRELLPQILEKEKDAKIVFWLDAHYSGGETFNNANPLLQELRTINAQTKDPIIFVDDARFIHSVYQGERYCEYGDFFKEILSGDRYVSCIDDTFVAVPRQFTPQVDAYSQEISNWQWQQLAGPSSAKPKKKSWSKRLRKWLGISS